MRRVTLCGLFLAMFFALGVGSAKADKVYRRSLKGKTRDYETGVIAKESAQGIGLKGGKFIPASDVSYVEYDVEPINLRISTYRPALKAEQDSYTANTSAEKGLKIKQAIEKYNDTLKGMQPKRIDAVRAIQYRIAALNARQVVESFANPTIAIKELEEFKKTYPDSWQITDCLQTLAEIYTREKKYSEAVNTYNELAKAPVAKEVQQEASLLAALVSVDAGKHTEADRQLRALTKSLPASSPIYGRAKIAEASNMFAMNKTAEGQAALRKFIKETTDNKLKAYAYNALGESFYNQNQIKEARWAFLWVDVIYNQDPDQHSKALYYLWKIFLKIGEQDRARECLEILEQPKFTGLPFQRRATAEKKSG